MAIDVSVFGPAQLMVDTGDGGELELLGYSVDGITISITHHEDPIMSDLMGNQVQTDSQYMGSDAEIEAELIYIDQDVLAKVQNAFEDTEGTLGQIGSLYLAQEGTFRLLINPTPSPGGVQDAFPYNFPNTYLIPDKFNTGTKRSTHNLRFKAFADFNDNILYNQDTE